MMSVGVACRWSSGPPGRTYRRGEKWHVASSPNYPPNVDTNTLRASLHVHRMGKLHYQIRDGVEYGIDLENGIGMAPRPFVAPVFHRWKFKIGRAAQQGIIP